MNSYELADDLWDKDTQASQQSLQDWAEQSANMLRQQADRITALEKQLQESAMDCISAYAQADEHYARLQELEAEISNRTWVRKLLTEEKQSEPVTWMYCPECGCEDVGYEEGKHKQCSNCGQEWFADIDYSDEVQTNLKRLYTTPQTKPHPKCDEACMYLCQFSDADKEKLIAIFLESFALGHRCGRVGDDVAKRFNEIEDEFRSILQKTDKSSTPQTKPLSEGIAKAIHYPDCWDDVAYPTLESALSEVYESFKCTNEDTHQTKPLGSDKYLIKRLEQLFEFSKYRLLSPSQIREIKQLQTKLMGQ